MSNIAKFDAIRLYLRQQFPKHHITDFPEGTSRAQDLPQILLSSELGNKLKEAGASPVMVSKTGFSTKGTTATA